MAHLPWTMLLPPLSLQHQHLSVTIMTKLIKKVQLNTEQNDSLQSADSTKGIVTNPFTEEEYEKMLQVQNWNGGYVDRKGFMPSSSANIYFPYYLRL